MKKHNFITIFKFMCIQSLRASKGLFFVEIIVSILHALCLTLLLFSQQRFFDAVTENAAGTEAYSNLIYSFIFFAVILVLSEILNGLDNFFPNITTSKMRIRLRRHIQDKVSRLSLYEMENPKTLDMINKAEEGRYHAVCFFYLIKELLTFYLPYFLFMSIYLFRTQSYIALGVIALFIPVCFTHIIHIRLFSRAEEIKAPIRRRKDYFSECICGKNYYKETRLLGAYRYFYQKFNKELKNLLKIDYTMHLKCSYMDVLLRLFSSLCYCGTLILSLIMLINKQITLGMFVALINGITLIFSLIEEMVYQRIGSVSKSFGNINNYFRFLENYVESDSYTNSILINGAIRLDNVSFSYPNSTVKALDHVSLTLEHGESLAIVGENGSGKSTLSKIMMGLFTPQDGRVFYGSENIKAADRKILFSKVSAVFQDFSKYKLNLRTNIKISSDIDKSDDELAKLCKKTNLDIYGEQFPDQLDTILSTEFDGVDLSGGEWQRVAICRALSRPYSYIFLDEPTSAIDPIEEMYLYQKFSDIASSATSVIITHRLGVARIADRILVMKDGHVVESGNHDDLLEKNGEYKRLWNMQKEWYIN